MGAILMLLSFADGVVLTRTQSTNALHVLFNDAWFSLWFC